MHTATERVRPRPAWALASMLGTAAYVAVAAAGIPRTEDSLPQGVEVLVVGSGLALLLLAARTPKGVDGAVTTATGILGAAVIAYPTLFAIAVAEVAGPFVTTMGMAWHTLPLTLVQVIPVMASARATGRSKRPWLIAIWGVAVAGFALAGLSVAGVPGTLLPGTVLFLASFVLAPVATWIGVRGTVGETRRRAIVAALAAMFPVILIVWCQTLGYAAVVPGGEDSVTVAALFTGFALGTLLCGWHGLGAVGAADSLLLRSRTVALTLTVLLAGVTAVLGSLAALVATHLDLSVGVALLIGGGLAAGLGLPWLRFRASILRLVDPAAELRHELQRDGAAADGSHRDAAQRVLRKVLDDPGLELRFPVDTDRAIDTARAIEVWDATASQDESGGSGSAVTVARRDDGAASVVALASHPDAARRLALLGPCEGVFERAVWEARAAYAALRTEAAAEDERRRVSQDLHDGLQGKLVGLALQLRLSAPTVDDPAVRLLLDETVNGIRDAVDEVRALAGGQLPHLLVEQGLAGSLPALFRPVGRVVDLDLPAERLPALIEATAYFVISEAVANALKHASAETISVRVAQGGEQVVVTVSDNGRGGADPRAGSGLRGLSERVGAAGGVLVVRDAEPAGTVVEAVLPCAS
ncbi:sensor histidine kinase [Knoellia subterranea]|nr:histidine kinase [Knoellia subterranea]